MALKIGRLPASGSTSTSVIFMPARSLKSRLLAQYPSWRELLRFLARCRIPWPLFISLTAVGIRSLKSFEESQLPSDSATTCEDTNFTCVEIIFGALPPAQEATSIPQKPLAIERPSPARYSTKSTKSPIPQHGAPLQSEIRYVVLGGFWHGCPTSTVDLGYLVCLSLGCHANLPSVQSLAHSSMFSPILLKLCERSHV